MRDHLKARPISHSVQKANPLFNKKDLALSQFQNNVNKQGQRKGYSFRGKGYGQSYGPGGCGYNANRGDSAWCSYFNPRFPHYESGMGATSGGKPSQQSSQ